MTTIHHDEDPKAPPICDDIEASSGELAKSLCQYLVNLGYDFALVTLDRVVHHDGLVFVPGALCYAVGNEAVVPALTQKAEHLRRIADELEERARKLDVPLMGGFVQDVTGANS